MVDSHRYEPDKYVCEHCSKGFAWRPNLLRHKMVHGEFRRFPCENCDKVFTDPSNLQRHIRTSHVGARCHACPECGKTFATSSGLKQHTHIHSSVKPFRCEVCFKAYTQFSNLCRHKRMHANCRMQIKCHKCGQAFSTVTSLSKHRRFCDSTPSPFLPGHVGRPPHGPPRMPPIDQSNDMMSNGGTGNHFSPFSNKFPQGAAPFLQPPFTSHLQSLFAGQHTGSNFPFLQNHGLMFPTMLQRMALNHLNGKSLLSPGSGSGGSEHARSPGPGIPIDTKPPLDISAENNNTGVNNGNVADVKQMIDVRGSESLKNIEEFRQRLLMNGQLDNKKCELQKNGVNGSIQEQSEQKLVADIKPEIQEQETKVAVESGTTDSSSETSSGFDVNRNKSDTEPAKVVKSRDHAPLDLSTPRKIGDILNDSSELDNELVDSPKTIFSSEEKLGTKESDERPQSPGDEDISRTPEQKLEEPRGFKPVGAKSFVPVTEISLFPKTSTSVSSSELFAKTTSVPSEHPSAMQSPTIPAPAFPRPLFSPETSPAFPRPVNPFLLGAMYRLNQNPYSPFHPSMSSPAASLPPLAPRPLPFTPPFMNPLPSSPFLPSSLPLLGRLGCYSDVLAGHNKTKDRYGCKFCGKVFPRSANLTRHLRTHTGEQPYKCKYCERSFSISSNLQRHVRNIHNKEKPFKCPLCERCFGQQTNLDRHLKKHETCSDPSEIVDSPESMKMDDDMGYFDEIRSFMGKVVDKNCSMDTSENEVDVEEDDDDDIIADMD